MATVEFQRVYKVQTGVDAHNRPVFEGELKRSRIKYQNVNMIETTEEAYAPLLDPEGDIPMTNIRSTTGSFLTVEGSIDQIQEIIDEAKKAEAMNLSL